MQVEVEGLTIEQARETVYLGVRLSENVGMRLNWSGRLAWQLQQ